MQVMKDAGVEFVPFDSQALNDVSANAWGGGLESYAYEDTDTLARQASHMHLVHRTLKFASGLRACQASSSCRHEHTI